MRGLDLFQTLENGDQVCYHGETYTVQHVQHDFDYSVMASEGGPRAFCYAAELIGPRVFYLKNLPGDPTLPIIHTLESPERY